MPSDLVNVIKSIPNNKHSSILCLRCLKCPSLAGFAPACYWNMAQYFALFTCKNLRQTGWLFDEWPAGKVILTSNTMAQWLESMESDVIRNRRREKKEKTLKIVADQFVEADLLYKFTKSILQ